MSDANKAVFLSYARDDATAARRVAEALRSSGLEVWFDENELRGGDSWDAKIRRQINECTLFVAIISKNTESRAKGYFRLEWKLAVEQTHMLLEGVPFVLPVVIDDTPESAAAVPPEFLRVQWTRLPGALPTPQFIEQIKRLLTATIPSGMTAPPMTMRPTSVASAAAPAPAVLAQARWGFPVWAGALLGVAVLALVGYLALRPAAQKPAPPAQIGVESKPASIRAPVFTLAPTASDPKSVAVLAFENFGGSKDNEYFSDGLSENILDKLARVPGLRVMARTSSFSYKGRNVPVQQIAQELHVGTVIEGSVQRAGNQLRVVAQLINAADGMHVWSETYDRELTAANIFALQDEIALKIAGRLAPNSIPAATTATAFPTQNLAAYEAYLRGRDLLTKTSPSWPDAEAALQRAVELDPQFALAWADLGRVRVQLYQQAGRSAASLATGRSAIDRALQLQPDLPEAHLAMARFFLVDGMRRAAALRELDLAGKDRPDNSETVVVRSIIALLQGDRAEAIALMRRAVELDPHNGVNVVQLGLRLQIDGRYDEAEKAYDLAFSLLGSSIPLTDRALNEWQWHGDRAAGTRSIDEVPADLRLAGYWRTRQLMLYEIGDFAGSLASGEKADAFAADQNLPGRLFAARAREELGDVAGAQQAYRIALPMAEQQRIERPAAARVSGLLALIYAGLGRRDEALATARKSLELVPPGENPYEASGTLGFARIQGYAALAQVQARFGLTDEALAIVKAQAAAGWWRRNYLLLSPDWSILRRDPRFRAIAEKAPL